MTIIEAQDLLYTMIKGCTSITSGIALLNGDHIIIKNGEESLLVYIPLSVNTENILTVETELFLKEFTAEKKMSTSLGSEMNIIAQSNLYYIYYDLENLYQRYRSFLENRSPIYSCDDLKEYEEFQSQMGKRAAEGLGWMRLANENQRFIFPISKFISPVNKPDQVSVEVFPDTDITNIYHYIVFKKKFKSNVHIYMRTLIS